MNNNRERTFRIGLTNISSDPLWVANECNLNIRWGHVTSFPPDFSFSKIINGVRYSTRHKDWKLIKLNKEG